MTADRHALPVSSYIATMTGPCLVSALLPGDEVVIVKGDGSLGSAPITTIESIGLVPCVHLLSKAGQLVTAVASRVTTKEGHLTAGELLRDARAGRRVRLEVISPHDLPRVTKKSVAQEGAASAYALFDGQVLIPWTVASLARHEQALADLENVLGERVERLEEDGWLVLRSRWRLPDLSAGRPHELAAEAVPLTALMAWAPVRESWSIRSPLSRVAWTQRALAALAAAGTGASATWQPGYYPVEARIEFGAPPRGHYDLVAGQGGHVPCLGVHLEERGTVVLCGAMVDASLASGAP